MTNPSLIRQLAIFLRAHMRNSLLFWGRADGNAVPVTTDDPLPVETVDALSPNVAYPPQILGVGAGQSLSVPEGATHADVRVVSGSARMGLLSAAVAPEDGPGGGLRGLTGALLTALRVDVLSGQTRVDYWQVGRPIPAPPEPPTLAMGTRHTLTFAPGVTTQLYTLAPDEDGVYMLNTQGRVGGPYTLRLLENGVESFSDTYPRQWPGNPSMTASAEMQLEVSRPAGDTTAGSLLFEYIHMDTAPSFLAVSNESVSFLPGAGGTTIDLYPQVAGVHTLVMSPETDGTFLIELRENGSVADSFTFSGRYQEIERAWTLDPAKTYTVRSVTQAGTAFAELRLTLRPPA